MNNFSCRSFFPCIAQYTHSQVIKQINYQILVVQQPLEVKEPKNQESRIPHPGGLLAFARLGGYLQS